VQARLENVGSRLLLPSHCKRRDQPDARDLLRGRGRDPFETLSRDRLRGARKASKTAEPSSSLSTGEHPQHRLQLRKSSRDVPGMYME